MSHQLRAKIQFNAIAKIKEELISKQDYFLVVMDNKHKVFPMKFCEGRVEYFGRKGISLLGSMIISHYPGNEIGYHGGFQYEFFDVIVEG